MTERNPILQSLFDRKSVRVYEEKPIPAEMKQAILEAAAQAPSAGCQQLYTILDITDPALKEALAESCDHQPFIAKAPLVLVFRRLQKVVRRLLGSGLHAPHPGRGRFDAGSHRCRHCRPERRGRR